MPQDAEYVRCRYEPFLVAEAPLGSSDPASDGGAAFRTLAGYLFGGNAAGERMAMTAPVISSTSGVMQFYVGGGRQARRPWLPLHECTARGYDDPCSEENVVSHALLHGVRAPAELVSTILEMHMPKSSAYT